LIESLIDSRSLDFGTAYERVYDTRMTRSMVGITRGEQKEDIEVGPVSFSAFGIPPFEFLSARVPWWSLRTARSLSAQL
jgi:hypothetical protein